MKRIISLTLAATLASGALLTGCGTKNDQWGNGETVINIRLMNEPQNVEKAVAVYKEKVKDDPVLSKIHPNITYVGGADYKEKLNMAVAAQENYDLMFCGAWQGLSNYVTSGTFKDVLSYFDNPEYPGLQKAFSKDFIEASKTGDALYAIPLAESFEDLRGVLYREDLRKKYNLPEIDSDEDLMLFLQTIKDNEPDIIPWEMSGQGFMLIDGPEFKAPHSNIFPIELSNNMKFYVSLDESATKVNEVVVMGDAPERFAKLPSGYQTDFIADSYVKKLRWVPYLNEDRLGGALEGRETACQYGVLSGYAGTVQAWSEKYPGSEVGFYVTEESQRNMEEGAIVSEMKSNNFICIPAWSEKTDEVMKFLDWMFASKENHDLFQYGIKGVDWEGETDDSYRQLKVPEAEVYAMPGYSFTFNPTYIRYNDIVNSNPKIKEYYVYQNSAKPYKLSPMAGFTFDTKDVKTELASVLALADALRLNMGAYGDETMKVIAEFNAEASKVGLETLREELRTQVQEFLNAKNK